MNTVNIIIKNKFRIFLFLIIVAFIFYAFQNNNEKSVNAFREKKSEPGKHVTVRRIKPSEYRISFSVMGEVRPEWYSTIRSGVRGKIIKIDQAVYPGSIIKKGHVLVETERIEYVQALNEARLRLANAEMLLLREKKEVINAEKIWKGSGLKPSQLALHLPQLKVAEREYSAAETALKRAGLHLDRTLIRAPFNCVVSEKKVSLGDHLFIGDEVMTLLGTDRVFITLYITEKQSAQLPPDKKDIEITLLSEEERVSWSAEMVERGSFVDPETRLIPLTAEVRDPLLQNPPLLPGKFVKARIRGGFVSDALCIDESFVSGDGNVWYVTSDNVLRSYKPGCFFREGTRIYIKPPSETDKFIMVAVSPDSTYLDGIKAKPVEGE